MSGPIIRSLDQIIATADGGEMSAMIQSRTEALFEALGEHIREHQKAAKGEINLKIGIECSRLGEVDFKIKPEFKFPQPPAPAGTGRAFLGDAGEVTRHPQAQIDFIHDVSGPGPKLADHPKESESK